MKKINPIYQDETVECGLACICMVLQFFGYNIPLSELREKNRTSTNGVSLYELIMILKSYHVSGRPISLNIDSLKEINTPSILLWNRHHFVVLESVKKSGVTIIDPAVGRRSYKWKDASQYFSGIALETTKLPNFTTCSNEKKRDFLFSRFWCNIPRITTSLIIYMLPVVIALIVQIISPKLFSITVDEIISKRDEELLSLVIYIFSAIFIVNYSIQVLGIVYTSRLKNKINTQAIVAAVNSLSRKPIEFFERRNIGTIIRRLYSIDDSSSILIDGYIDLIINCVVLCLLIVLMFITNTTLSFFISGMTLLYVFSRYFGVIRQKNLQSIIVNHEAERDKEIIDLISNISSVKLYNTECEKVNNYAQHIYEVEKYKTESFLITRLLNVTHTSLIYFSNIIICYYGAKSILEGENSLGELLAFTLYKDIFMNILIVNLERLSKLKMQAAELEKLQSLLSYSEEQHYTNREYVGLNFSHTETLYKLSLHDVSFSYSKYSQPILDSINIELNFTDKAIIYGHSGSGKTTLLKIISGLYMPTAGVIKVNNIPLVNFGVNNFRRLISVVSSDDEILCDTVLNNICYGVSVDNIDIHYARECLKKSGLDKSVASMPYGLNTVIGHGGIKLSSGEKQRLLIARGLYKKTKLMIFDEPTSHLDINNRDEIIMTIQSIDCMCIIITHDPAFQNVDGMKYHLNRTLKKMI
ncbi:Lactococcin-G-processing and transport ATP-binding protein LagD [Escherichia coli]|uniref:peptidase domain-containing ABC transporter n=1 Tax=Escherichia coli TaxID=562 RepID=UPI000E1CD9C8|nr:cysteine peptidase family C39 domain-containing protein [Escherichia coli]EFN8783681.1 ATP-binding cassette domain-containing protein [Escherichia coli]RDP32125.1 Lactococcin-G-processing and transport ATP-binding protein LagD [Escherichia coli]HBA9677978.1 ATP-binding cassette domain-containing protein [Escherichia coli]HBB0204949.1 ATP-binding cassette domain-containing protein [Escherichia coli]